MKEINKNNLIRSKLETSRNSQLKTYKDLTVGNVSFFRFVYYEIVSSVLGPMPGGLGLYLRKIFYPGFFKKVGKGFIIGRNVVVRHPRNIELGDFVTIDDNCLIDGRGAGTEGIIIEDHVIINRNCMIQAKNGHIKLGKRTSLGSNSTIFSVSGVELGEAVLTAAGCTISGGNYKFDDTNTAIMDQSAFSKGPIIIGSNTWLGTSAIVLDGVKIGEGAIIGAATVVYKKIPDFAVALGVPAQIIKYRKKVNETDNSP